MSFSFYDRVQSGQLISRANSDIRAVQMYLSQAPFILVQCSVVVLAFVEMLSINVPLAFVALSTMPFVFIAGVKMRQRDVPGVVADPGPPRRRRHRRRREHPGRARREVVRGGGRPAPDRSPDTRRARRVGERRAGRHPVAVRAADREPAARRAGARAALRRLPRDQRPGDGRRHRRRSTPTCSCSCRRSVSSAS